MATYVFVPETATPIGFTPVGAEDDTTGGPVPDAVGAIVTVTDTDALANPSLALTVKVAESVPGVRAAASRAACVGVYE